MIFWIVTHVFQFMFDTTITGHALALMRFAAYVEMLAWSALVVWGIVQLIIFLTERGKR